jgi:hypothetical protein
MHGAREQKSAHAVGEIKIHKREREREKESECQREEIETLSGIKPASRGCCVGVFLKIITFQNFMLSCSFIFYGLNILRSLFPNAILSAKTPTNNASCCYSISKRELHKILSNKYYRDLFWHKDYLLQVIYTLIVYTCFL